MHSSFQPARLREQRTDAGRPQGEFAAGFATLDPEDQTALLKIVDALVTKTKLRAGTAGAS